MSLFDNAKVVYWLRDPLWGAFYYSVYQAVRALPCRTASSLGARLGLAEALYRHSAASLRAKRCLSIIRPDLTPQARAQVVREMWQNVGRVHAEMAVIDRLWDSAEITLVNEHAFRDVQRHRRPVLLLFSHLGNWETLAIAMQRMGFTLNVVYENIRNRFERNLANRSRRKLGYRLIAPTRAGVREIFSALARGEAVALAMDEIKNANVIAPAFGRPLPDDSNVHYALRLARRFGAAILPLYCVRTAPLSFRLSFLDEMIKPDAVQLNALCETWIRAHPEQWYMLWRLAPEGLAQVHLYPPRQPDGVFAVR